MKRSFFLAPVLVVFASCGVFTESNPVVTAQESLSGAQALYASGYAASHHHLALRSVGSGATFLPSLCAPLDDQQKADVWSLDLADNALESVPDLSCFSNLKELNLSYNRLREMPRLDALGSLGVLNVHKNTIATTRGWSAPAGLSVLTMGYNGVTDLSGLAGLGKLRVLELQRNAIADVSPLAGLTSLVELRMEFNVITDFRPLSALKGLGLLTIAENPGATPAALQALQERNQAYLRAQGK